MTLENVLNVCGDVSNPCNWCDDNVIKVSIHGVRGNQVRLSIDAPRDVIVDREEIHLLKQKEKVRAD